MKEDDIEEGFWVFISHSTKDFERVRLVRNALEDSGFRPILFYLKCLENENEVNDLLKREIDARKRFILCDSPNAQASKFVQSEVDYIRSKNRMYEIIDLSQIDMESQNAEKEVLELIKPFRRRTSVFISYSNRYRSFAKQLESELIKRGFKAWDMDFYWDVDFHESQIPGTAPAGTWDFLTKRSIEASLSNGYVIGLIGEDDSANSVKEIEYAFQIRPSQVLPVIIGNQNEEILPDLLQKANILDVSHIASPVEKAKAIIDELISLDLRNQIYKYEDNQDNDSRIG